MPAPMTVAGLMGSGFVVGSLPQSLFALKSVLATHVDEVRQDRLVRRALFLPAVAFLPVAGHLADAWGARDVAIFGLVVLSVGLGLVALTANEKTLRVHLAGLAFGLSFAAVGTLAWFPDLAGPSRVVEAMCLGFIGVGLGRFVGPVLVERLSNRFGVKATLLTGAALSLAVACVLIATPYEPSAFRSPPFENDLRFWLMAAVLALYFPVESCVETWCEPLLREIGRSATRPLFGFAVAYLGARAFVWWFPKTGLEPWLLLTATLVSAMVLGNLTGAREASAGRWGFILAGACYGPLIPGFLGMAAAPFPGHVGAIVGWLLAMAALYRALLIPALHRYLKRHPVREAMRWPILLTLAISAPLLVATLIR